MDEEADRMFFGRCLNELCDDWESAESVCAGLGIGPADTAGAGAVGDCLRRAVAEGLAEAFDFKVGTGFVRHDGGLEEMAGLWFAITERGRAALEEMPEVWFSGAREENAKAMAKMARRTKISRISSGSRGAVAAGEEAEK